jgi:hypothetical protein
VLLAAGRESTDGPKQQPERRVARWSGPRGAAMEENQKPGGPAPMPHDERRWRVAPATDGRGMPEEHKPAPRHRVRWFWVLFVALLAVNSL